MLDIQHGLLQTPKSRENVLRGTVSCRTTYNNLPSTAVDSSVNVPIKPKFFCFILILTNAGISKDELISIAEQLRRVGRVHSNRNGSSFCSYVFQDCEELPKCSIVPGLIQSRLSCLTIEQVFPLLILFCAVALTQPFQVEILVNEYCLTRSQYPVSSFESMITSSSGNPLMFSGLTFCQLAT